MPEIILPYEPIVIADTTELSRQDWLALRKTGIGGSEVAAVFGISPFGTARDVYYDKLDIVSAYDNEANKYQKKIGTLLEDIVAEIFAEQTGYQVFKIRKMYRSREHSFMIADIDFFVLLPDGTFAILECKTTAPDATGKWWHDDGSPAIPANYQLQGRQYMSVMHINKTFFACLYGNSEHYFLSRELNRDLSFEDEMIAIEGEFWNNHVLQRIPPPYIEEGNLILESVRRHYGPANQAIEPIKLMGSSSVYVSRYLELQREKSRAEISVKSIDRELQRMKGLIVSEMGAGCIAVCNLNGVPYQVTYKPIMTTGINKSNLARLQAQHPDIYDEYVTVSESRRFHVKEHKDKQGVNAA